MNKHIDFLTADTIWQHDVNIIMYFFLSEPNPTEAVRSVRTTGQSYRFL